MNSWKLMFSGAVAFFVQTITSALGGFDATLRTLVFLLVIDFVTGLAVAAIFKHSGKTKNGALSSGACLKGIVKKMGELCLVWLAVLIDSSMNTEVLRPAIILFLCGSEGISILENLGAMGVPYPAIIKNTLASMSETGAENE